MTDAPRYEIKTVHDFLLVPEPRRAECLREFLVWLGLCDAVQGMMHGIKVGPPDAYIWVDDGKHEADISITDGVQKIHVASGVMRGFGE